MSVPAVWLAPVSASRPGSMSASETTSKRSAHWPYRIARRNWPPECPPPTTSVRSVSADGITPCLLACQGPRQRGFAGCPDPELVSDEAGRRVLPHRRVVVRPERVVQKHRGVLASKVQGCEQAPSALASVDENNVELACC